MMRVSMKFILYGQSWGDALGSFPVSTLTRLRCSLTRARMPVKDLSKKPATSDLR